MRGVSVITVCRNAEATIGRTIESVSRQTARGEIEYIVVDGLSGDGTVGIVRDAETRGKLEGVEVRVVSERDSGIYDAMNKGLRMATGEYVWFVNAGDEIAEADTVEKMLKGWRGADVLYGDTLIVDDEGRAIGQRRLSPPEELTWRSFRRGMLVSHQSFVARRELCPEYDTQYKYSADFDWCVKILKKAGKVANTRMTLSRFLDGGMTKHHIAEGLKERFRIMTGHYGIVKTVWSHIPIAVKFFWFWITKGWF